MNEVNKARELRALMRRPESLSKEFPWNEVLAEEKVFVNHDGSLGAVFKITLAEHETMVEDAVVSAVNSLKTWFSVPENAVLQVIFEQLPLSPLDKRLDQYTQRYLDGHPVSRFLFEQRIEAIRSSCGLGREGTPLERRAFLTVRWFPQGRSEAGLLSFYKGPSATLADEKVRADSELAEFLGFLRAFESNSQTKLTRLGGSDLLSVLRQFFNPEAFYRRLPSHRDRTDPERRADPGDHQEKEFPRADDRLPRHHWGPRTACAAGHAGSRRSEPGFERRRVLRRNLPRAALV